MSDKFDIKSIDLEIKDDQKGEVAAVFSVFDSLDSDGDIIKSGAIQSGFKSGDVPMVWAHKWDMPIGKGQIVQDEGKATFKGNFFMDTESGKEAYNLVKAMGDLQQWSFGFKVNDSEYGKYKQEGEEDEVDVRYLKDLTVYEVSPVLVGANQETYTMAIKSNTELVKDVLGHSSFQSEEQPEEVAEEVTEEPVVEAPVVEEEVVEEVVEDQPSVDSGDVTAEEGDETVSEDEPVEEAPVEEAPVEEATEEEIIEEAPVEEVSEEVPATEEVVEEEVVEEVPEEEEIEEIPEEESVEEEGSEEEAEEASEEEVSEEVQKTFSEEVQDALAALGNLIDRAKAISSLRVEDGRKLGAKATEALRTVQDDLSNAWAELDQFIEEVGTEEASESNLDEQQTGDQSSADNSESEDDDFDAQWIEGQRLLAETLDL
tara:strand:- start:44 stop:1330 length:1287 start_codon:yes stop_codon:yes gene_type:complete